MRKTIYDLELHETISIRAKGGEYIFDWQITRVPGGWMYMSTIGEIDVFVPFSNEFQSKKTPPPIIRKEIKI